MIRQTVPDGYYPVSEVAFSHVIVTVMLNQFIFITSSPNSRNNKMKKTHYVINKMLSYRRETALQGTL